MATKRPSLLLCGYTYCLAVNRMKAEALSEYFDVTVATLSLDHLVALGKSMASFEETERNPDFDMVRFDPFPVSESGYQSAWTGFGKWMKSRYFDVVLVEGEAWAVYLWQIWWHTARAGRCGTFAEFSWENIERTGIKGWILDKIYRLGAKKKTRVIAGNIAAGEIWKRKGLPESHLRIGPQLGVDENFHPVDSEQKQEIRNLIGLPFASFIIGFIGRFVPEKGVQDLIEAVKLVRESSGMPVTVALLGNGPEKARYESLGLPFVQFLQPCKHREVAGRIQAMDLMVLPSRSKLTGKIWEEQFGHVIIEATSCGVPVLGSDSGAIPEVLSDPDLVFPQGDVPALAALIGRAVTNPEWLSHKADKLRNHALENYTHQAVARFYADFLLKPL